MRDRDLILFANEAFYQAFAQSDFGAMEKLWAKGSEVSCIHPGWKPLNTRLDVLKSWRDIFSGPGVADIICRGPQVFFSDGLGVVICYEVLGGAALLATNIFILEGAHWKIRHHHAGGPVHLPPDIIDTDDTVREKLH